MGKIKGWKKTGKWQYRKTKTNGFLQIGKNKQGHLVQFQNPSKKLRKVHTGTFKTQTQAKKFALKYMKKSR
jgi:hypothetical protein